MFVSSKAVMLAGIEYPEFGLLLVPLLCLCGLLYIYYKYYSNDITFGSNKEDSGNDIQEDGNIFDSDLNPDDMEVFQRPMCFVKTQGTGSSTTLDIETETIRQISKIKCPLVVVAIAGLYRTGKSYLMNRLAGSTTGFALGNTIESKTKGIWAWCKIHPKNPKTVLLLLDTEGLGDIDKGDPNHDNNIFILATLLCSCLIYNMKGTFDQDALNKLTFITEISKNIRFRHKTSEDKVLGLILPDFVLCLRDFTLVLSKNGKPLSEDKYIDACLAEKKDKDEKFNKPRQCIRKYFNKRKCFTFPAPGGNNVLVNLETLQCKDLSEEFNAATDRFVSHIYKQEPKALITSKPVNGQMFATLATSYVKAIKDREVPDVDDAFAAVAKKENSKVFAESIEIFKKEMGKIVLPLSTVRYEESYMRTQEQTLRFCRENLVHDTDWTIEEQVQMRMDSIWNTLKEDNCGKIKEDCKGKLEEMYDVSLDEKINRGDFKVSGGYKNFQYAIDKLKEDYFNHFKHFKEHEILLHWHDFMKTLKELESTIIQEDNALTKKEKEEEQKRSEEYFHRFRIAQQEAQQKAFEKQQQVLEQHLNTIFKDRLKQKDEEMKRFKETLLEKVHDKTAITEELFRLHNERKSFWFGRRMWDAFWNK